MLACVWKTEETKYLDSSNISFKIFLSLYFDWILTWPVAKLYEIFK